MKFKNLKVCILRGNHYIQVKTFIIHQYISVVTIVIIKNQNIF